MAIQTDTEFSKDHTQALADIGMYVLMGEINAETVKPVIEWILHENFVNKKRRKELLLMICSEGGAVQDAFALIDVMRSSLIPVKTVGLGMIASSGLLIFLAGSAGRRVLTPNTSILSHQFSWYNEGKVHEFFSVRVDPETRQLLSEDYFFCKLARSQGIKVHAALWAHLDHVGTYVFTGNPIVFR